MTNELTTVPGAIARLRSVIENAGKRDRRAREQDPHVLELVELCAVVEMIATGQHASARWEVVRGPSGHLTGGIIATATGLNFPEDLLFEDWENVGLILQALAVTKDEQLKVATREVEIVNWWIADWLNYGERRYGETYAQAAELTGLRDKTLANIAWVGRKFAPERRRADLSWSHHAEVAGLPVPQADVILDDAQAAQRNGETVTTRDVKAARQRAQDAGNGEDHGEATARRALEAAAKALAENVVPERWARMICRHLIWHIGYHDPPEGAWFAFLAQMRDECCGLADDVLPRAVENELIGAEALEAGVR